MLVAISRNSEAKAMTRSETRTLRYRQRAAAASREAVLSCIDISIRIYWRWECRLLQKEVCLPRRASDFLFSRCIQEVIGCLTISCDSICFRFIILVISMFSHSYE